MSTSAFRLGSVAGFEIRVDYSWFVIFFLILWTLSSGLFPAYVPGLSRPAYLVMGVAGSLLFFLSLLGHELSHSFVARAKGIEVAGITLFIFGGMAHTKQEATRPGDEFQIAAVGPFSSLVIALLFRAVVWVGAPAGWSPSVIAVAAYLAQINVLLAVFNLLPGFPLDGGRIFRSIVWKATGSMTRATRWAANGGRTIGYGLMAWGLYDMATSGLLNGVWLIFIGWFLRNAAVSADRQRAVTEVLEDSRVEDVMTPEPETVDAELSVQALADDVLLRRRYSGFPVSEGGRPVGIVTLEQVRATPRDAWRSRRVRDIMSPLTSEMIVAPQDSVQSALQAIQSSPARRALVVRDGTLVGMVVPADLAEWVSRLQTLGSR